MELPVLPKAARFLSEPRTNFGAVLALVPFAKSVAQTASGDPDCHQRRQNRRQNEHGFGTKIS